MLLLTLNLPLVAGVTFGSRLKTLSGLSNATVGAMLLAIGTGATVGEIIVNYSGLPTGTVSEHLLVDHVVAPVVEVVQTGGGWAHVLSPRTKKKIEEERKLWGIKTNAARVIDEVALNLISELEISEKARKAELKNALELKNIKYEIKYLNALNAQYEQMLNDELAYRMQMKDDELIIALLM